MSRTNTEKKPLGRPRSRGPHPADILAGQRLRQIRTELGQTQEDIAAVAGVSFQQVQKYENGVNRMSSSRLQQFASHFGVDVGYFFTPAGHEDAGVDRRLLEFSKLFRRIPPRHDHLVRNFLQALIHPAA
ncbi:MAG: helix-turn-helix domain-containing protein [Acetobacteraceae bacterium]